MPNYYFHLRDGDRLEKDPEGSVFSTVEEARAEAVLSAREMLAEKVAAGATIYGQVFEITSEDGVVIERLPLKSVLKFV